MADMDKAKIRYFEPTLMIFCLPGNTLEKIEEVQTMLSEHLCDFE
jgi:hypothetical protein